MPGGVGGVGGPDQAHGLEVGVGAEPGGAVVGGRHRHRPAPRFRPLGGAGQLGGDRLVRGGGGGGEVPGAAVAVGLGVGERPVDGDAAMVRGLLVGGGPDQRVAERQPRRRHRDQAGPLGRGQVVGGHTDRRHRPQDHVEAGGAVGGRHLQGEPRRLGEPRDLRPERLLHPPGHLQRGHLLGQVDRARVLGRPVAGAQLDQRQRVAAGLGQHPGAQRSGQARRLPVEQVGGGLGRQARDLDRRDPGRGERHRAVAGGEQDRHGVGLEPAGGEQEGVGRAPIEPLGVVDHDQQRRLGAQLGEEAQRAGADQEPAGRRALGQAERRAQRRGLGAGQAVEAVEERVQQQVEGPEGQLGLRLDPDASQHPHPTRRPDGVVEQRRLPDPGVAPQHQRPAAPLPGRGEQAVDRRLLVLTSHELGQRPSSISAPGEGSSLPRRVG